MIYPFRLRCWCCEATTRFEETRCGRFECQTCGNRLTRPAFELECSRSPLSTWILQGQGHPDSTPCETAGGDA